ncbi:MAG: shikimate kinase [Chitinophagaceae bacterium]
MKLFFIGFMGCGKTHWGKAVSNKLQLPFFDLDEEIVQSEGKSINDLFGYEGEEYFRMTEKDMLYKITETNSSFVMATGGGTPCFFNNIDYLNKQGLTIWINCSVECLFSRLVKEKEQRPLIRSLTDHQLHSYIQKKYFDRKIFYQKAKLVLQGNAGLTLEKIVNEIFHH